jgi:hypothetical protein
MKATIKYLKTGKVIEANFIEYNFVNGRHSFLFDTGGFTFYEPGEVEISIIAEKELTK